MHPLTRRLRKLETRVDTGPSWNDYFAEAVTLARSMLPPAERNLVAEASARWKERGCRVLAELPSSVLERWRSAFDRAVVELRIPCSMVADDAWL